MQRILFTLQFVTMISGSDLHVLALAKEFKKRGWEVDVFTLYFDGEMKKVFQNEEINVIHYSNDNAERLHKNYDIIWGCHYPVFNYCLTACNIKANHIIYNSLSPYVPMEELPIYHKSLSKILCNSQETLETHIKNNGELKNASVFPNYAPKSYFEHNLNKENLNRIVVVSNHIPEELNEAVFKLKAIGYEVDVFGTSTTQVLVDDNLLENYDLVISIGKTVNYAMALKIPVYCYDHFGGCGYFNLETLENEFLLNFSGRYTNRKISSDDIVQEIEDYYKDNLSNLEKLKEFAYDNFCFENLFDQVLDSLDETNVVDKDAVFTRNELEQNFIDYLVHANNLEKRCNDLQNHLDECNKIVANNEARFKNLKKIYRFFVRIKNVFKRT